MMFDCRTVVVSIIAGGFLLSVQPQEAAAAGVGCCMKRAEAKDEAPWVQIPEQFSECEKKNREEDDDDNILEPLGLYRWNIEC